MKTVYPEQPAASFDEWMIYIHKEFERMQRHDRAQRLQRAFEISNQIITLADQIIKELKEK